MRSKLKQSAKAVKPKTKRKIPKNLVPPSNPYTDPLGSGPFYKTRAFRVPKAGELYFTKYGGYVHKAGCDWETGGKKRVIMTRVAPKKRAGGKG